MLLNQKKLTQVVGAIRLLVLKVKYKVSMAHIRHFCHVRCYFWPSLVKIDCLTNKTRILYEY